MNLQTLRYSQRWEIFDLHRDILLDRQGLYCRQKEWVMPRRKRFSKRWCKRAPKKIHKRVPPATTPTEHHRRPTSIGGSQDPRNRIGVPQDIHRVWHELFVNMCTPSIVNALQRIARTAGYQITTFRSLEPLHRFLCPSRGCAVACEKRLKAKKDVWDRLQKLIALETNQACSFRNTMIYINSYLLDSDYHIRFKRI